MKPLNQQVILVTGATDGLGKSVAAELVRRGATVILHGRDEQRIADALSETGAARAYRADFASLEQVHAMAREILDNEERIDTLVNNAGIGTVLPGDGRRVESEDGYELRFQVNYLAHYVLTRELLPAIDERIVNVSSAGQSPIDFGDPMLENGYSGGRAYTQSKLAQVMFTIDLAEELRDRGVTVNCLHPATYMPTKMVLEARGSGLDTIEQGTEATVRLVADPELDAVTGRYFNGLHEAAALGQAYDEDARRQLRDLSERLVAAAA
jgi:NAD(P)-dependent dehydrogenase (short-subunit alcohol dehydrogenase family)